jgi:hypothetical protein
MRALSPTPRQFCAHPSGWASLALEIVVRELLLRAFERRNRSRLALACLQEELRFGGAMLRSDSSVELSLSLFDLESRFDSVYKNARRGFTRLHV